MTAPALRPTGQAAAQLELLARLGLPASASPEDLDALHEAASEFLAAAPIEIRGWARAQVAALDAAYISLTDPVGLEGSALMSPASPPTVAPGGPATPPARRGPAPAASPVEPVAETSDDSAADALEAIDAFDDLGIEGDPSADDLAALYAMVTPSAHDDMKPRPKAQAVAKAAVAPRPTNARTRPASAAPRAHAAPAVPTQPNVWKTLFLGVVGIAAVFALVFGANAVVNGLPGASPAPSQVAQASSGAPAVDQAKVADLMGKFQADPTDQATLLALADEFYAGRLFEDAATWLDKLLALNPEHIQGLLARGAVAFNLNDLAGAKATWEKVAALEPDNIEVHYDLGFLYLNQATPDYAGVQREWGKVVELDPSSKLAQTVQAHLESLAGSSMLPSAAPASSANPAASPVASPATSPAASDSGAPSPEAGTTP